MTAEVVIMNVVGVAMAADSAVTIGTDARKIFTSTDKLFQLSGKEPIGVMTYGSATLLGVPWETIVKQYRLYIGRRRFTTVADYASSFFDFIRRNLSMFPMEAQRTYTEVLIARFFRDFRERRLRPELDKEAQASGKLTDARVANITERTLLELTREIQADCPRLPHFRRDSTVRIANSFRAVASKEFTQAFGSLPMKPRTKVALIRLSLGMLSRRYFPTSTASGLVFAGFGTAEFLPSAVAYFVDGFVDRRLRLGPPDQTKIKQFGTAASVIPFAQREVVETFMEGVDPTLKEQFSDQAKLALTQVGGALISVIRKRNRRAASRMQLTLDSGIPRVIEALNKKWDEFSSSHWQPITEIVSTLPKDELAAMAEALVNLTKFKRRITPQRETVGGPIDVAVITKGDGFVWIRRKHYFEPSLNPRVIAKFAQ